MQNPDLVSLWTWDERGFTKPALDREDHLKQGLAVAVCTYRRAQSLGRFLASLAAQERQPEELIIVDASPDADTEEVVKKFISGNGNSFCTKYVRVRDSLRGLTRQRNLSIKLVGADLTCFFDDDVVLRPGALDLLEKAIRANDSLIASACHIENEIFYELPPRWRLRKVLGLWHEGHVGYLNPAGMAIPQGLWLPFTGVRQADIVPGGATCWRTWVLRAIPFDESFVGYGQAEDLEYSLRTKPLGDKVIVGEARVLHLHDQAARISPYEYGQQCGRGFALIFHRYGKKSTKALLKFAFWQLLDIFMLSVAGVRSFNNVKQAWGRCMGLWGQIGKKG
jgi:glycosyltransferase involved in cell wall biosynthesis